MLAGITVRDRICTIGGTYAAVTANKDDLLTVEVGGKEKSELMIARWAVRSVEQLSITNDAEQLI